MQLKMKSTPTDNNMKPKFNMVLDMCLENGIERGWNRAHKHHDNPTEDVIKNQIYESIMEDLHEWFDFEYNSEDEWTV